MKTFDQLLKADPKTDEETLLVQALATLSTQGDFASMTPEGVYETVRRYAFPPPATLFFFDNGMTMAGDGQGRQIPRYQGPHAEVLARLEADGVDLSQIPETFGRPDSPISWSPEGLSGVNSTSRRPGSCGSARSATSRST